MSNDPAVLFYTSDFLSKTIFFTYEQKGQYIHLLCTQHQNGHIPEKYMIEVLGNNGNPVWSKFDKDDKGLWYQKRMDFEKERRTKYSESRRKNVNHRYSTHVDTHVVGMKPHMENETVTVTDNITITNKDGVVRGRKFIPPSIEEVTAYCLERKNGIDPNTFLDYYQARGWKFKTGQPVKDWKACIRTWESKNNKPVEMLTETQKRNIAKFNDWEKRQKGNDAGINL